MDINKISEAITKTSPMIEFEVSTIINDTIYGDVGIYGDSYECTISLINNREIFIGFSDFVAMNEVQHMIPVLQKLYYNTLNVEYGGYNRNSRYGITLKQY